MEQIKVKVTRNGNRRFLTMYYDDPLTGKREQRSTKETTKKAALKAAGKWEDELNSGRYCRDSRITWEAFLDRYDSECLSKMAPHSREVFKSAANHFTSIINPKHLAKITPTVMSRFQTELRAKMKEVPGDTPGARPKNVRAMSETTISTHLRHLKAAFNWAVRQGLLPKAPFIEMPKKARGETVMRGRPITTEEFERMLAAVGKVRPLAPGGDADKWTFYLRGLWLSGLRLEESTIVSWDEDSPFWINMTGKHPKFRIFAEAHKARRNQISPMTPEFEEFLLAVPPDERTGRLFKLLDSATGRPLAPNRICRIVSKIGKAAGVVIDKAKGQYATAHDLRRSFATRLLSAGVSLSDVKSLMRHSSIQTTDQYYLGQNAEVTAENLWRKLGEANVRTPVRTEPKSGNSQTCDSSQLSTEQVD